MLIPVSPSVLSKYPAERINNQEIKPRMAHAIEIINKLCMPGYRIALTITVLMAPGPAIKGNANGIMAAAFEEGKSCFFLEDWIIPNLALSIENPKTITTIPPAI